MSDEHPEEPSLPSRDLRARLAADIAAGKTVSLSSAELAAPDVRAKLPGLLEELSREHASTFASPLRVPGYTILGEVGHGGMSTVYLARQQALGRHVAVKIAPKWLGGDRRTQQRLLQEARAMARVPHPNVVAIHDILEVDDTIAIAMEWIDGLTLAAILRILPTAAADDDMALIKAALGTPAHVDAELEPTPVRCFARMLHDVARAVQHVHDAGLLHLDIKPSNVLVRRDGTPLLADFGVVRDMSVELTHTRTFAGTPVYSAPEQLRRDDGEFGPHTDVYALGMTLYEALARQQPLQQLGISRILQDVMAGRVPHLSARADVPPDLANIVHKAIAPEPRLRYPTAAAFADDLLAFLEHRPVTARPLSVVHRLSRWARNEPWKAALAGALALLLPALFTVGGYLLSQLPRIEQTRREEQRAIANTMRQAAYQAYFGSLRDTGWASDELRRAMELDRTDSSLACLLAMAHEEEDPQLEAMVAGHRLVRHTSLGMRLFAEKVREHRAFFEPSEVAKLLRSSDPTDRYVLALDRLFWAEDCAYDEAYAEAEQRLEEAAMMADGDMLLFGLRAWSASRSEHPERLDALLQAMAARWPDSVDVLTWRYFAQPHDHEPALVDIKHFLVAHGSELRGWEILLSEASRRDTPDGNRATTELLAQATRAAGPTPALTAFQLVLDSRSQGAAGAQRALDQMAPEYMTFGRRIGLLRRLENGSLERWIDEQLAKPRPPWQVVKHVHGAAFKQGDRPTVQRMWELWQRDHSDRFALNAEHIRFAYDKNNPGAVADIARKLVLPVRQLENNAVLQATVLADAQAWPSLRECATRWRELGPASQRAQASTYVGLAATRLGDAQAAAEALALALAVEPEQGAWYAQALLEDAWLRVAPGTPSNLRDPALALHRLNTLDQYCKKKLKKPISGRWPLLTRAEVLFANGDRERAIAAAETAARFRGSEPYAPDGCEEMVRAALERYRK